MGGKSLLFQCSRTGQILLEPDDQQSLAHHLFPDQKKPPPMDFTKDFVSFKVPFSTAPKDHYHLSDVA